MDQDFIDKMNDCLAAGLKDLRAASYNNTGWKILLDTVWKGHSLPPHKHPAFKAVMDDMHKNAASSCPKSRFEGYSIELHGQSYTLTKET